MNKPRLIDANELIKWTELVRDDYKNIAENYDAANVVQYILDGIIRQPTAYDVTNVVEQLERLKRYEASESCPKDGMCKNPGGVSCKVCYTNTAIEIVKGGAE